MSEIQTSGQVSHESQGDEQNTTATNTPVPDSGSVSVSTNDTRKVSQKDIVLVRQLLVTFFFMESQLNLPFFPTQFHSGFI